MGLQDRDYYGEKFWELTEKEEFKKPPEFKIPPKKLIFSPVRRHLSGWIKISNIITAILSIIFLGILLFSNFFK